MPLLKHFDWKPKTFKRIWVKFFPSLILRQPLTLIYGPGRVGSTSIFLSLLDQGYPAAHTHHFPHNPPHHQSNNLPTLFLFRFSPRPFIINTLREPFSWIISNFIRRLRGLSGNLNAYTDLSIPDMINLFNHEYLNHHNIQYFLHWHHHTFNPTLGIDAFSLPFPKTQGYLSVTANHYPILFVRSELPDITQARVITRFLHLDSPLLLTRHNTTDTLPFADKYRRFKQALKINQPTINKIYSTPYARHFYGTRFHNLALKSWSR